MALRHSSPWVGISTSTKHIRSRVSTPRCTYIHIILPTQTSHPEKERKHYLNMPFRHVSCAPPTLCHAPSFSAFLTYRVTRTLRRRAFQNTTSLLDPLVLVLVPNVTRPSLSHMTLPHTLPKLALAHIMNRIWHICHRNNRYVEYLFLCLCTPSIDILML